MRALLLLLLLLGARCDIYWNAASNMSRAIVLSVVFASVIQGVVAAIGYWLFGLDVPILLGVATAFSAIIPFVGTALIWVPASAILMLNGHPWLGGGMLVWGFLLIHPVDNVMRPMLISNATHIPFILSMFGVLGGLAAFGLIGLFLGPVVIAVALAFWNEWVDTTTPGY